MESVGPGREESARGLFARWDDRASVRQRPRRVLSGTIGDHLPFPPESVPALAHPLLGDRTELHGPLLSLAMYQYMFFTTAVENHAVIPVAMRFAMGDGADAVTGRMRRDAFKICTDEAWHAQFSYDFIEDAAEVLGVRPALGTPDFVERTARIRDGLDAPLRPLFDILFAVVTETLISRLLSEIPRDTRLLRPVRDLVADHALDEGRHHAYFKAVLQALWPTMSASQRGTLGALVPELIEIFLKPDVSAAHRTLRAAGVEESATREIVADCYRSARLDPSQAAATVAAFRSVGAFDDGRIHDAFRARGLTP